MLASTTPDECIQERTASGSSFMLAVAPRGRLSWIPNISRASTLRPPLPHNHEDKTTRGKQEEEKSTGKKEKSSREKNSSTGRTEARSSGRAMLSSRTSKRLQVRNQLGEEEIRRRKEGRRRKRKDLCRRKWPRSFIQLPNFSSLFQI